MSVEFVVKIPQIEFQTIIHLKSLNGKKFGDEDFENFVRENSEMRIEQTKEGEIIIMPGTGALTGNRNFRLAGRFWNWVEKDKTGVGFDSSTIFTLPNGARRSPDVSWIRKERWNALTKEQQEKFSPICPDFVVELRSKTDSLKSLQAKMNEYIENGAQLGWLIDPTKRKVHVYCPNKEVEILNNPKEVSGDPVLPGFTLKLKDFWE